jgi:hypothetical protein
MALAAVSLLSMAALSAVPVAAAQPPIRLSIAYGYQCLSGTTASPATISVLWRDSAGRTKAQGSMEAHDFWTVCSGDEDVVVEIGDKIRVSDGSYTRHYVVPDFTVTVDRVSNTFHGTGPAGRTIRVAYAQGLLSDFEQSHSVRVGQDGSWTYDPDFDIPGGQYASLYWVSPNGDNLETHGIAPQIDVTIGQSTVRGWVHDLQPVRLVLLDGASGEKKAIATDVADQNGAVLAVFRNESGNRVPVAVGDTVRGRALATDLDWIVPGSEAVADVATDVVTGACHDAGQLSDVAIVEIHRTGRERGYAFLQMDESGQFQVDFGGRETLGFDPANIKHGDRIAVRCMLATGDWVVQSFDVP